MVWRNVIHSPNATAKVQQIIDICKRKGKLLVIFHKNRETLAPHLPVVAAFENNILMRTASVLHPSVETFSAGRKDVIFSDDYRINLRSVLRQLVFVQHRREKSHMSDFIRAEIRHIRRDTSSVAESGYSVRRDTIGSIDHIHQVADRTLYLMLAAEMAIVKKTFPEITMTDRPLFERPFVAIRHHKNHRPATSCGNEFLQGIHRSAFILPRAFVAVDTMNEKKHRKRVLARIIRRRQIDVCAAEYAFVAAEPHRVNDLRRCGAYGVGGLCA